MVSRTLSLVELKIITRPHRNALRQFFALQVPVIHGSHGREAQELHQVIVDHEKIAIFSTQRLNVSIESLETSKANVIVVAKLVVLEDETSLVDAVFDGYGVGCEVEIKVGVIGGRGRGRQEGGKRERE